MRRLLALGVALFFLPLAALAQGAADEEPTVAMAPARTPGVPRIAVLDTGINASHPEFAPGQIVAWRDFTSARSPTPVDLHGHGTFTASLVAGANAEDCGSGLAYQKTSFASGAELVIGRVAIDGSITGSVRDAIQWAVQQDVDVISMSFGSILPTLDGNSPDIRAARAQGVLVVVAAGNGLANRGVAPYPSWLASYGADPHALVVGGAARSGALMSTTGNSDPEVVSWSDAICGATAGGGYARWSGTSFSTPLVAGMAATLMQVARDAGHSDSPDAIERLVHLSATNNLATTYHREGLGFLLSLEAARARTHAAAGTLPDYEAQGRHARLDLAYHDEVAPRIRDLLV